jgi:hypothetical protein
VALSADIQTPCPAEPDRGELTDASFDPHSFEAGLTCTPPSELFQMGKHAIPCYNLISCGPRGRGKCRGDDAAIRSSAGVAVQPPALSSFWTWSISKAILNRSEESFRGSANDSKTGR